MVSSTSNIRLVNGFIFLRNRDEASTKIPNIQPNSLRFFGNHTNSKTSCVPNRKRSIEYLPAHQAGNADHQIAPLSEIIGDSKHMVTSKLKSITLVYAEVQQTIYTIPQFCYSANVALRPTLITRSSSHPHSKIHYS